MWVKDHKRTSKLPLRLYKGDYFGEIALFNNSVRTATVKSSNYCTMSSLNKTGFIEEVSVFPLVPSQYFYHKCSGKEKKNSNTYKKDDSSKEIQKSIPKEVKKQKNTHSMKKQRP